VLAALALATIAVVASAAPASAAASITVDPSTASPGQTITISGNVPPDQCPSTDPAQLTSSADLFPPDGFGPPAGRAPTGDFSTQYTLNDTTPLGTYTIGVRCGGGNVGISANLDVVGATPASITINPSSARPGDSATIAGNVPTDGCPASDAAQLTSTADLFPPDGFGPQASRDASGAFSTTYTIPTSTPAGSYSVGVRCGGGNVGVTDTLVVTAASTTTSSTTTTTSTSTTSTTLASSSATAAKKSDSNSWWRIVLLILVVLVAFAALLWRRRAAGNAPG